MDEGITLPTQDEIERIAERIEMSGQLAKSWTWLTRFVREHLGHGRDRRDPLRIRRFGDGMHYLTLELDVAGRLWIQFGVMAFDGHPQPIGRLGARWDHLGLTGPYRIELRGREYSLNVFCAVLKRYARLPEMS